MTFLNGYLKEVEQNGAPIQSQLARRDRILLNISFFGLLGRSNIFNLKLSSIHFDPSSKLALAHIIRSKTDQEGDGYTLPILTANTHFDWTEDLANYLRDR